MKNKKDREFYDFLNDITRKYMKRDSSDSGAYLHVDYIPHEEKAMFVAHILDRERPHPDFTEIMTDDVEGCFTHYMTAVWNKDRGDALLEQMEKSSIQHFKGTMQKHIDNMLEEIDQEHFHGDGLDE